MALRVKLIYSSCLIIILFGFVTLINACDDISSGKNTNMKNTTVDTVLYTALTKIQFQDTLIDLGQIKANQKVKIKYPYTNTGENPLMIFYVSPGCGCTIASYSQRPLLKGQTDTIVAEYDSKGNEGRYMKTIKVGVNTEERVYTLSFKVEVNK